MRFRWLLVGCLAALPLAAAAQEELAGLSDEFDDAASLAGWQRLQQVEGWPNDQVERLDIGQSVPGCLTLIPRTSVWYQDFRGILLFKEVSGDFVVSTYLRALNRAQNGAPGSQFSLGGLLIRTPREVTPQTWRPGGENYCFLSYGAANAPGRYQLEAKTTVNSDSQLQVIDRQGSDAMLQIAKIGPHVMLLARTTDTAWHVVARYHRPDMPAALQVGLTAYTDWPTCNGVGVQQHNTTVIQQGNPDVIAIFDYVRYRRPAVPAELVGRNLADAADVPDAALLGFLGEHALE